MHSKKIIVLFFFLISFRNIFSEEIDIKIQQVNVEKYPVVRAEVSVSHITPVLNLNENNFDVYENEWKVENKRVITSISEKMSKKITILVNVSETLSEEEYTKQIEAVKLFIEKTHPKNKIAIISFNGAVDKVCDYSSNKQLLLDCLNYISRKGNKSVLYEALIEAVYLASKESEIGSSIVLFTNGDVKESSMTMKDVISLTRKKSIPIYIVGISSKEKINEMSKISAISGGQIYFVLKPEEIKNIYLLLAELMDNTYLIEYLSKAIETGFKNEMVELKIVLKKDNIEAYDSYKFFIADNIIFDFWHRVIHKKENLFYAAFIIILLLILLIIYKKTGSQAEYEETEEFDSRFIYEPEQPEKSFKETIIEENNEYIPEKKHVEIDAHKAVSYDVVKPVSQTTIEKSDTAIQFAYLLEKEGVNMGKKHGILWRVATIGFDDENLIVIKDPDVSYSHSKIERRNDKFYIFDLISDTGTFLNGKKLLRPKEINDFDEITIGSSRFIFRKILK
ncbi:MAG: VWA domain-containing protein [Spirochaetia bacterium]|nr:VWA domain-containing protein [Spirochaetia bacterium]